MVSPSNHEVAATECRRHLALLADPLDLMVSLSNHEVAAPMPFYVYILECADGSYYTGLTRKEPEQREWEHNAGVVDGYTSTRRPVILKCIEEFESVSDAIDRERQIKGWSRRKKQALIAGDYENLPRLSKKEPEVP